MGDKDCDMFLERLQSHVEAYLDHLITEYMTETTELETVQPQYQICHLPWITGLDDTPRTQILLAASYRRSEQPQKAVNLLEQIVGVLEEVEGPNYHTLRLYNVSLEVPIMKSINLKVQQRSLSRLCRWKREHCERALELLEHVARMEDRTLRRTEPLDAARDSLPLFGAMTGHFRKTLDSLFIRRESYLPRTKLTRFSEKLLTSFTMSSKPDRTFYHDVW